MRTDFHLRLVVSPSPGRLRFLPPERFIDGFEWVERGQALARIEHGGEAFPLLAPVAGRVTAVLAVEGEPMSTGHLVMAIEPEGA